MLRKRFPSGFFLCLAAASALSPVAAFPESPPSTRQDILLKGDLVVKGVRLTDNGDNDGFADPNETVNLFVTLRNSSGANRDGIVVTVASTDLTVDCIPAPTIAFGTLAAGEVRESAVPAMVRIASVARSDPFAELTATFDFTISGGDFGGTVRRQQVTLDLDLNVSGGLLPGSYSEGFEGATFGTFTTMTLDVNMGTNALSDGFRCQYNDPDFPGSFSFGNTSCYLGASSALPANNAFDWHLHTNTAPDAGRAYLGAQSLHWGIHPGAASADTTRLRQLDAIRTTNPINLGWNGVTPELTFKHQVGLTDTDYVSGDFSSAVDRGIVQVQLANSSAAGVGTWRKLQPYENVYDSVGHMFSNCLFDPTDDGNTEDDYFDPTDPDRRFGPSSTCAPEFGFSRLGAIFWNTTFDPLDDHHASDGPGLQGSLGPGTWVESKFDLSRYRGRRVRLRFLVTTIEVANAVTMQQALGWNPIEADDGWYIDDVRVTGTLVSTATVAVDTADRSGLPACGPLCGSVTASLVPTPDTVGPDEEVTLDASGSTADVCPGGLHYRFGFDSDSDGVLDSPERSLLQDWGPNAVVSNVSDDETVYVVEARCSGRPLCVGSASVLVPFVCQVIEPAAFDGTLLFNDSTHLAWTSTPVRPDAIRGDLGALRASGGQFDGTVQACVINDAFGSGFVDTTIPPAGQAFYYLAKEDSSSRPCVLQSWSTFSPAEIPGAGGNRDADIPQDPDTCPVAAP
jgi:hypothetical protein